MIECASNCKIWCAGGRHSALAAQDRVLDHVGVSR